MNIRKNPIEEPMHTPSCFLTCANPQINGNIPIWTFGCFNSRIYQLLSSKIGECKNEVMYPQWLFGGDIPTSLFYDTNDHMTTWLQTWIPANWLFNKPRLEHLHDLRNQTSTCLDFKQASGSIIMSSIHEISWNTGSLTNKLVAIDTYPSTVTNHHPTITPPWIHTHGQPSRAGWQGVPSVRAAVETGAQLHVLRQDVHQFPLALGGTVP